MRTGSKESPRHPPWTPDCRHRPKLERLAATTIVVVYGGSSNERAVSLVSGAGILAALGEAGGAFGAQRVVGVEIDAQGRWCMAGRELDAPAALALLPRDALFFLGLHGGAGEDGRMQAFLEIAGRAYTGSGPAASTLCMDKHLSRLAFSAAGLRVAAGLTVRRPGALERAPNAVYAPGIGPWFVKPVHGGSSLDTRLAESSAEVMHAVGLIHASGDDALVEQAVLGLEVTVGVIGNRSSAIRALPLVEILPRRSPFFDHREKYATDGAIEICPAEHLTPEQEERVAARARTAYAAAGCDGYARIDFILPRLRDGSFEQEPVLLEANSLPGFTPTSLIPREAAALGVSYRELCLEICILALERHEEQLR